MRLRSNIAFILGVTGASIAQSHMGQPIQLPAWVGWLCLGAGVLLLPSFAVRDVREGQGDG